MSGQTLSLVGYADPVGDGIGFVLPVFRSVAGALWMQNIRSGRLVGVQEWHGPFELVNGKITISTLDERPVFGFRVSREEVFFGVRHELSVALRELDDRLLSHPLVRLDVLMFIDAGESLREAVDAAAEHIAKVSPAVAGQWRLNKIEELVRSGMLDESYVGAHLGGTVLVVDDSLTVRECARRVLNRTGLVVSLAADGAEALELVRESVPDVMLIDVRLPGINGVEVCRQLKLDHRIRHVPVVFMSSVDESVVRRPIALVGETHFLQKPVSALALVSKISELLPQKLVSPAVP